MNQHIGGPLCLSGSVQLQKKKCLHGGSSQKSVSKQILDEKCVVFVEKNILPSASFWFKLLSSPFNTSLIWQATKFDNR